MSASTADTSPNGLDWPLEDEPIAARVRQLVATYGLPVPARGGSGHGTAVLRATGTHPLDDLLAWAGEMSREPHWWVLRHGNGVVDVHAAGYVHGLAVTISAPTLTASLPDRLDTEHVLVAAAAERFARPSTPPATR